MSVTRRWLLRGVAGALGAVALGDRRLGASRANGGNMGYTGKTAHMPLAMTRVRPPYRWPRVGFGRPSQYGAITSALVDGIEDYWFYDWSGNPYVKRHIPMIWGASSTVLPFVDDGRPLLILNEPELSGLADLAPNIAADVVWQWANAWGGELWPLGTLAHSLDYCDAVIDSYQARYGTWPGSGWAVHAYSNRAEWSQYLTQAAELTVAVEGVAAFAAHMRARGLLGRGIVVSECGVLSKLYWHQNGEVAPCLDFLYENLLALPDVRSVAWFSSYYEEYNSSDLVTLQGGLTPCGLRWRAVAEVV